MSQINPCPFCGGDNVSLNTFCGIPHGWAVSCGDCLIDGPIGYGAEEAVSKWNNRAFQLKEIEWADED